MGWVKNYQELQGTKASVGRFGKFRRGGDPEGPRRLAESLIENKGPHSASFFVLAPVFRRGSIIPRTP
jgi:hypothetical protein